MMWSTYVKDGITIFKILTEKMFFFFKSKIESHRPRIMCFLTCVSHTAHVIAIGWTSVRHTLVLCRNGSTAQPIVKLSSLPGSPMILVF